jgi:polyhydroxyalkanoate synthase subunit PhaC
MDGPKIPVDLIIARLGAEAEKAQQRLVKARDIFLGPLDTGIGRTPCDIIYEEDHVRLKHYSPDTPGLRTPLLLVHAIFNRESLLDLQPDRSMVQGFLKLGVEVYLVDWGAPSRKDRYLTLDDHINVYLDNIVDTICRKHGLSQINLMGISMGGTFALIYAALHPDKVKNLITVATPANFATDKGLLHIWMREIDVDRMIEAFGNIPGNLLNVVFLMLNPARMLFDKYLGFLENMDNKDFVENYIRTEKWIFDSPDIPGETLRQIIKDLYQQNLLIQNKMELGGHRVELRQIVMPLMNLYGRYDHLVPPEASEGLSSYVASEDTQEICLDTGHIGLYVSARSQKELIPQIAAWLSNRDK